MQSKTRREFLKTCTAAGLVGVPATIYSNEEYSGQQPVMCIARYKNPSKERDAVAKEAEMLVDRAFKKMGGMSRFVAPGEVVWVKPNICFDRHPELAVNSNPDVVGEVVRLCLQAGAKEVLVGNEPTGDYSRAYERSGIGPVAKKAGAKVFILEREKFKKLPIDGKYIKEWEVYKEAVEADKLICIATVKHHPLTKGSMGMKGLMGLISGPRYRFHNDLDNSIPDLAAFLKPEVVVLDAIRILKDNGPYGGNPKDVERKDTIAVGTDQVAVDAFGATLLGLKPPDIGYIKEADSRGMGRMDFESLSPVEMEI